MTLVDVSKNPIERFTKTGIIANGVEYTVDTAVCATGFAAMTGSFDKINITGRGGLTLAEKWRAGPRTYLGLSTVGFPNLFLITGPGSPSVLANMIPSIEQHVDWMTDCMAHLRDVGAESIEPVLRYEDEWVEHVNEVANTTLYPQANSWYMGANIPGKPRLFMPYIGGVGQYRKICEQIVAEGYKGFRFQVATAATAAAE